jgi:hypothetical protein
LDDPFRGCICRANYAGNPGLDATLRLRIWEKDGMMGGVVAHWYWQKRRERRNCVGWQGWQMAQLKGDAEWAAMEGLPKMDA